MKGDISQQEAIRKKLQCKPFKWFLDTIANDVVKKFPLPSDNKVWGEVNKSYSGVKILWNLTFFLNLNLNQIVNFHTNRCIDSLNSDFGQPIGVLSCHRKLGNQVKLMWIKNVSDIKEWLAHNDDDSGPCF